MATDFLRHIVDHYHLNDENKGVLGITSVCSAHPIVIEAALRHGKDHNIPVLIEATCNQVNQDGGYTGMTPDAFRDFVCSIAANVGFDIEKIILGGDHLGPNPWTHLPPEKAMEKAKEMIAEYARAGFTKLHLDTSMGCLGETVALDDKTTAQRAVQLAKISEENCNPDNKPLYIIGTEVPVPGGATHSLDDSLDTTEPKAVEKTHTIHKQEFDKLGLMKAFERVIGMVVQPGVEFGHSDVIQYDANKAVSLTNYLKSNRNIVFEAHSTDYQTPQNLHALVSTGFCILKVGPWLTFALREALYALDNIADVLSGKIPENNLMHKLEIVMLDNPKNWQKYYNGSDQEQFIMRHFSLSDRIRYYWNTPQVQDAVNHLMSRLENQLIPAPLLHQYLGHLDWAMPMNAHDVLIKSIYSVLEKYHTSN